MKNTLAAVIALSVLSVGLLACTPNPAPPTEPVDVEKGTKALPGRSPTWFKGGY